MDVSTVISTLKTELEALDLARRKRRDPSLFALASVEVELTFTIVENDTTKGGFDLKVIQAGLANTLKHEEIQKVRVTLHPSVDNSEVAPLGSRFHSPSTEKGD
jgi:hypothetical protein